MNIFLVGWPGFIYISCCKHYQKLIFAMPMQKSEKELGMTAKWSIHWQPPDDDVILSKICKPSIHTKAYRDPNNRFPLYRGDKQCARSKISSRMKWHPVIKKVVSLWGPDFYVHIDLVHRATIIIRLFGVTALREVQIKSYSTCLFVFMDAAL